MVHSFSFYSRDGVRQHPLYQLSFDLFMVLSIPRIVEE